MLTRSFGAATGEAAKKLTELQRKSAQLAARQQALQRFSAVGTAFRGVATEAAGLALGLGAVATAAGAGLFRLAQGTAAAGDRAIKTAQNLGVEVEALQELWYAAERSGAKTEDLDKAIRKMSVGIGQAAADRGEAKIWFEQLGIDARQLAALRPEEAMGALADALGRIEDPARRAAASQAIFGEGALRLGVMLDEGSAGLRRLRAEARATGGVLGRKAAEDAATFQDRLLDLQLALRGLKNTFGAALLPVFIGLFVDLAKWLRTNQERVRELAERFALWLRDAIPRLRDAILRLKDLAERIARGASAVAEFVGGWDNLLIAVAAFKAAKVAWSVAELGYSLATASKAAWGLASALMANPATWFIGAALAEVGAIYLLVKYWDQWTGWLQRSAAWVKVLAGYLLLIAPPLWLPLLLAAVIHNWDQIVVKVKAFGSSAVEVFGRIRTGLGKMADLVAAKMGRLVDLVGGKVRTLVAGVRLVVAAVVEVVRMGWRLVEPIVTAVVEAIRTRILGLVQPWLTMGRLALAAVEGFFGLVVGLVAAKLSWILAVVSALGTGILTLMGWLWDQVKAGWALFAGWFSGMWSEWGATVKGIVAEVLASVLNLLSTPLRVGVALANALPGQDSPHLVELRDKVNAALAQGGGGLRMDMAGGGIPTVETAGLGQALAGSPGQSSSTTNTQSLALTYSPQIAVSGGGGTAGMQAALKTAQDDLLKKMQAALEQQKRLSYG
jgi:hypothetical protein